jgi:anti-sigma-K factor RskA
MPVLRWIEPRSAVSKRDAASSAADQRGTDSGAAADQATHEQATVPSWRHAALATAMTLTLVVALGACGSSSKSTPSLAQVKRQTCQQVEAVLSDGPEPEADPVGYAQAQILPLRQIHTSDQELHAAIGGLASAYRAFSSSNGSTKAKHTLAAASRTIAAICPGVTS